MLAQRVASAAVAVPVIFLLVVNGGWPYAAFVALALGLAAAEIQHFRHEWFSVPVVVSWVLASFTAIVVYYGHDPVAAGVLAILCFAAMMRVLTSGERDGLAIGDTAWLLAVALYLGVLGSFIVLLRTGADGRDWVFLALLATYATDTASYFGGRAFGRHLLAPRISPKKTVEGLVWGVAGGFAASVTLNYLLGLRIDASQIIALGLLLPLAAAAGDLAESAIKRLAKIKDASDLIPGHGGVLDRLDSLLFAFTLAWLFREIAAL